MYILPEISAHHLQLKCMGQPFFFLCHPYIESTTVLSDTCMYYSRYEAFVMRSACTCTCPCSNENLIYNMEG